MAAARKPVIGVPASITVREASGSEILSHSVGDLYIQGLLDSTSGLPVTLPALGEDAHIGAMVAAIDGLFLTGGRANIEPHHYGAPPFPADEITDPAHDSVVLALIPACIEAAIPILGTCRGLQEINVALGGSLHYRLHEVEGRDDHRMRQGAPREEIYGLRHPVRLTAGGLFAGLAGADEVMVNSLHGQGVDRLADGLTVEARAHDGTVEGVRLENGATFTAAVQWHAEWRPRDHPLSRALYAAFDTAMRERVKG